MSAAALAAKANAAAFARLGETVTVIDTQGVAVDLRAMVDRPGVEAGGRVALRQETWRVRFLAAEVAPEGLDAASAIGADWTVVLDGADRPVRPPARWGDAARATVTVDLAPPSP